MKRHPSLIPLSHGHHHGLVLAQRLKQGKSRVPQSPWPEDPGEQRDRTLEFYRSDLVPHFRAEEEVVFPLADRRLGSPELLSKLRREHQEMHDSAKRLAGLQGAPLEIALARFGELLADHIRSEERELFERMQESVPEEELLECGRKLKACFSEAGKR